MKTLTTYECRINGDFAFIEDDLKNFEYAMLILGITLTTAKISYNVEHIVTETDNRKSHVYSVTTS